MWSSVLDGEQRQPQDRVLGALDEGHGNAAAHLARVVKAEPLMGEMAATVDHELGTQNATERPPGDQRRDQRITKAGQGTSGPPSTLQVETHRQRQSNAPEAREPALPDGDPASRMIRVVAPIGGDVGQSSADQTGHNQAQRELAERLNVEVRVL